MGPGDRPGGCESGAASAPQEPRGAWQQAAWGFGGLEEDGVPVGVLRPSPRTARRGTARMGSAVSPGGNASGERGGWGVGGSIPEWRWRTALRYSDKAVVLWLTQGTGGRASYSKHTHFTHGRLMGAF